MFGKFARGAYLAMVAGMVAVYALTPAKGEQPAPAQPQPVYNIFC